MNFFVASNRNIILLICEHLHDIDKVNLLKSNKVINNLKYHIFFNQKILSSKIKNLTFSDRFTNVIIDSTTIKFLSDNVTHLTFGKLFNQNIKGAIPNSVTHLTFG